MAILPPSRFLPRKLFKQRRGNSQLSREQLSFAIALLTNRQDRTAMDPETTSSDDEIIARYIRSEESFPHR